MLTRPFTILNLPGVYFRDPVTNIEVQFVQNADYAPFAMRKSAWRHVGGIDESLSEPGECGIWGDWELCTRMWLAGYQVRDVAAAGRTSEGV